MPSQSHVIDSVPLHTSIRTVTSLSNTTSDAQLLTVATSRLVMRWERGVLVIRFHQWRGQTMLKRREGTWGRASR